MSNEIISDLVYRKFHENTLTRGWVELLCLKGQRLNENIFFADFEYMFVTFNSLDLQWNDIKFRQEITTHIHTHPLTLTI